LVSSEKLVDRLKGCVESRRRGCREEKEVVLTQLNLLVTGNNGAVTNRQLAPRSRCPGLLSVREDDKESIEETTYLALESLLG